MAADVQKALQHATPGHSMDRQIVLETGKQNENPQPFSFLLKHAAPEHKVDPPVVFEAVKRTRQAQHAPHMRWIFQQEKAVSEHKSDREVVLKAVDAVRYAAPEHKVHREVVLEVVPQNENPLQYEASKHKADRSSSLCDGTGQHGFSTCTWCAASSLQDAAPELKAVGEFTAHSSHSSIQVAENIIFC